MWVDLNFLLSRTTCQGYFAMRGKMNKVTMILGNSPMILSKKIPKIARLASLSHPTHPSVFGPADEEIFLKQMIFLE